MEKNNDTTIDYLMLNISAFNNNFNNSINNKSIYSIKDFNNVENADRKLIINNKFEFWVHDDALTAFSEYFDEIFKNNHLNSNRKESKGNNNFNNINNPNSLNNSNNSNSGNYSNDFIKTYVEIPHEEYFIDILFWIYTREPKRLTKVAKTFKSFINLVNLGIFLRMKHEFFEILLSKSNFNWNEEFFAEKIWSRSLFTYSILARIVSEMRTNNYTKLVALLSWLKDYDSPNIMNTISTITNMTSINEELGSNSTESISNTNIDPIFIKDLTPIETSLDLFLVRNYIKVHGLMNGIKQKEIYCLYKKFPDLYSALDIDKIISQFVFVNERKLKCLICHNVFNSPFEVLENLNCSVNDYMHPVMNNLKQGSVCLHEGCNRKTNKNELICCHRPFNSQGCMSGENGHMIVIE